MVDLAEAILDVVAAADIVFWPVALDYKRHHVEQMPDAYLCHLPERRHSYLRAGRDVAPLAR